MQNISQNRTKNYLKQVKSSFIFKFLAMGISFLIIPIMIKYLGNEQYGIWSTLLSIISWMIIFDIGIGSGLRNKLTESIAKNNYSDAKKYIATSYALIGGISLLIIILFLLVVDFIPWQSFFNTSSISNGELKLVVGLTIVFLFINFCLSLINQILNGMQKTSIVVFNQFLSNILSLLFVYLIYVFDESSSLFKIALVYCISVVITNILITFWFFKNNNDLRCSVKDVSKEYIKPLLSLGVHFFIIQIAVIVIFTTDKILITQLFGLEYVTQYDVLLKLFSIITIIHNIQMAPLWSAYADAYHRDDLLWIRNIIKKQLKLFFLLSLATIFLGVIAEYIIYVWISKDFIINDNLVIGLIIFTVISMWNNIFAFFINATNELNLQFLTSIVGIFLNIPISIVFVKYFGFGVEGVIYGTILAVLLFSILSPIQTFKLLRVKGFKCS